MFRGRGYISYAVGRVVWKCRGGKRERKKAIEEANKSAKQKKIKIVHAWGFLSSTHTIVY